MVTRDSTSYRHPAPSAASGVTTPLETAMRLLGWLAKPGRGIEVIDQRIVAREAAQPASTPSIPSEAVSRASLEDFDKLRRGGFIATTEDDRAWRITHAGLTAVRRARATPAAARLVVATATPRSSVDKTQSRKVATLPNAPEINSAESPLAWLRARKDKDGASFLPDHLFDAGERLRADFWRAHMTPRITTNWSPVAGGIGARRSAPGHGVEMNDHVVAARERVQRALQAVGPDLSGMLIDVCCHLKGLTTVEQERGWPPRSGKHFVLLALQALARHYGMKPVGAPSCDSIRQWGDGDWRPTLDAWRED